MPRAVYVSVAYIAVRQLLITKYYDYDNFRYANWGYYSACPPPPLPLAEPGPELMLLPCEARQHLHLRSPGDDPLPLSQ